MYLHFKQHYGKISDRLVTKICFKKCLLVLRLVIQMQVSMQEVMAHTKMTRACVSYMCCGSHLVC